MERNSTSVTNMGLNPCCNGYGFLTVAIDPVHRTSGCLNPCCNGYGFLTADIYDYGDSEAGKS